jgi:hypothetical protein
MRLHYILTLCFLISGCAYRATLRSDSPSEDFSKANRAFRSLRCQIQLADTTFQGQSNVQIGGDTVHWEDSATSETRQAPFADVYGIKAINHKKGLIPGALVGLPVGFAAGAAVGGSVAQNTSGGGGMDFPDMSGAIAAGFGVGVPVFLAGILIGYSIGAPVEVRFESFPDSTSNTSK